MILKIILCILIIIFLIYWITKYLLQEKYGDYEVVRRRDSKQAAKLMDDINNFNIDILAYLKKKYIVEKRLTGDDAYKQIATERLLKNYNHEKLIEVSPYNLLGDTSYTVNKGEILGFCLREKNPDMKFHDSDVLKFVSLHEMAHIANKSNGHGRDFWSTFKWLLNEAAEIGYTSQDFSKKPIKYCGLHVGYNPIYDSYVSSIPY